MARMGLRSDSRSLSPIRAVEWYLEQWGRWAYKGRGVVAQYPSIEPFTKLLGSTVPEPMIDDSTGEKIDRVICELMDDYRQYGEAVAIFYLNPSSYAELGKKMKCDRKRAASYLDSGKMWIDGRFRV